MFDKESISGLKAFKDSFHCAPEQQWFSPGRVNLIGEHTDYNGGWVLPAATDLGTTLHIGRTTDCQINVISLAKGQIGVVPLVGVEHLRPHDSWTDYIAGVVREMWPRADAASGLNIVIDTNLPIGSGLSSSASLTVAIASAVNDIWNCDIGAEQVAQVAKQAENNFVGVSCGILDPFSIAMAKEGHAIALNCGDMIWQHVELLNSRYKIAIANTGVPRSLKETPYNQRRHESQRALGVAIQRSGVETPNDLTVEHLDSLSDVDDRGVAYRRAKHIVSENLRVQQAVQALRAQKAVEFGCLMNQSHASLRDDYEVSCGELDLMVDLFADQEACIGAKMTGAGFGGSVVAIVFSDNVPEVISNTMAKYRVQTGLTASFSVCDASAGAHRLLE